MGRLQGKVALITGGAQGMGEATVRLFAREGARVVIADILDEKGEAVAADIGDSARYVRLDVRSEGEWKSAVAVAYEGFGRLDILVNNAGVVHYGAIEEFSVADAEHVFAVNVIGPMIGAKYAVPAMRQTGGGVIINISSVDGLRGCNGVVPYTASKWAIRGLSKSLAYELGRSGIRVCSIHPGGIDTAMGNPLGRTGEDRHEPMKAIPIPRMGEPEEVARTSLFIASDDASYITGAEIAVDGGWSAGYYQPLLPGAPPDLAS